jgi:hypothetical protein
MSSATNEPKGERWLLLVTAANDEAARAGHGAVDVDHLLLALLVSGGAATQILSRAGLDLATARTALVEVQRQDLSSLGVSTPVPPALARHTYGVATAALPWSGRARRALATSIEEGPDTKVLRAVLDDAHGPARRLLEQAGIDASAVLTAALAPGHPAGPGSLAPEGSRNWTSSHTRTVAVPRTDLWRVVRDPRRRPEWDDSVASVQVRDERSFQTLDVLARTLAGPDRPIEDPGLVSTHLVTDRQEGRLVEWETRYPHRGHTEWFRVELEDDGAGSRLTLRSAFSPPRGFLGLFSRCYAWTTTRRLKLLAQAIAQTASTEA